MIFVIFFDIHFHTLECPDSILPSEGGSLVCSVNQNCLDINCCVNMNIKVTELKLKAWLTVDPCNFTFSVGFEKLVYNLTLFNYKWGRPENIAISDSLALR